MVTQETKLKRLAILNSGLDRKVAHAKRLNYFHSDYGPLSDLIDMFGSDYVKTADSMNYARYKRKARCSSKVAEYVLNGECVFLTLTFKDEVLNSTSEKTRRVYVRRYLKTFSDCFVANIDFGGKFGREHYHALVVVHSKVPKGNWSYGWLDVKKVKSTSDDLARVSKYVAKLSNHAMKHKEGSFPRLIYSRAPR